MKCFVVAKYGAHGELKSAWVVRRTVAGTDLLPDRRWYGPFSSEEEAREFIDLLWYQDAAEGAEVPPPEFSPPDPGERGFYVIAEYFPGTGRFNTAWVSDFPVRAFVAPTGIFTRRCFGPFRTKEDGKKFISLLWQKEEEMQREEWEGD